MKNIIDIAKKLNINEDELILYGNDKAKIQEDFILQHSNNKKGKLVLVTAITPTKAGEGKTATTIGLVDGLNKIGRKAMACLREPSLGPVFGLKGGAVGGGKETIEPQEDINLHFTGDLHALTSSIDLISAIIDNHIFMGNELKINPDKILWKRSLDINDRTLRNIRIGIGDKNGVERNDSFCITVASELMAILCLAKDKNDFKTRLENIIVAYNFNDEPVYLKDLKISNAIMKLMKYALLPNLVQTCNENPVLVHGGPFANIAHGCNSLIATNLALNISPLVVTEAGFASDLGAEKFLDIKCRVGDFNPDVIVLVATIRALKMHGGVDFDSLGKENVEALEIGTANLKQHVENLKLYGVPVVIAINHFATDHQSEIDFLKQWCIKNTYQYSFLDSFIKGADGAVDLASKVCEMLDTKKPNFRFLYELNQSIEDKISTICHKIYHCRNINYTSQALEKIKEIEKLNKTNLPICIAKTQNSFSDNKNLLNAPRDFGVTVRDVSLSNGAGFIVVYLGNILTMPGLPKIPNAVLMEDEND